MKRVVKEIIDILKKRGETITFAESCTGGRVASSFTTIAGVSAIFNGSVVSYSNDIKSKWLGVKEETLLKYGAVSSQCVDEMLIGAIKMTNSNYSIAISGIAGPSGGTDKKPIGTVYIGVASIDKRMVKRFNFDGNRESIQNQATIESINFFKNFLLKVEKNIDIL